MAPCPKKIVALRIPPPTLVIFQVSFSPPLKRGEEELRTPPLFFVRARILSAQVVEKSRKEGEGGGILIDITRMGFKMA